MQPDLLILMCDTARADAFAPWGGPHPTPAVERLAAEGIVYDQASTPAPWTVPAHGSLFTGRLPTEHGITGERLGWSERGPAGPSAAVRAYDGPWLTESLRDRGYRTFGVTCNPWVGHWGGFDRGFDAFVDTRRGRGRRGRPARRLVARARQMASGRDHGGRVAQGAFGRWLAQAGDGPVFCFANLMEVHSPYDPAREFHPLLDRGPSRMGWTGRPDLLYYQFNQMGRFRTRTDARYVSAMRALYHATARYEDRVVGSFVEQVRRRGRGAVLCLVSDHGENIGHHGLFGHHSSLAQSLLHIPMVVWSQGVGLGEGRVTEPVSTLALADWLVELADERLIPLQADGEPVLAEYESATNQFGSALPPEIQDPAVRHAGAVPELVHEPGMAVRRGASKYVTAEGGRERLFDLSTDPGEERDLAEARSNDVAAFRPLRDAWLARRQAQHSAGRDVPADPSEAADEEIAGHLRDLGYIE